MNTEHYKAASERTDADERALIPAIKRTPAPNKAQHRDTTALSAFSARVHSVAKAALAAWEKAQ